MPSPRPWSVLAASVLLTALLAFVRVTDVHAQAGEGFAEPPAFSADGIASAVFLGGSVDDLEAAARGVSASGAWMQAPDGDFVLLIAGGPSFLEDAVRSRFPGDDLGTIAVHLVRGGGEACERVPDERLALLDERVGFGRNTTGGADGCVYRVTNLEDSGPGSLREGAMQSNRWIVFAVSGAIDLESSIDVAANTTVDGRGAEVTVRGYGLYLVNRPNVIITHMKFQDVLGERQDAIQIRKAATKNVWVNHVTIANVTDGHIDVTQGATDVTISWSRFEPSPTFDREKTIAVGTGQSGDQDDLTYLTLHHNLFERTMQRSPLISGTFVHSYNNYIEGWDIYGSGVREGGRLLSERNVYDYGGYHRARAFTPWGAGAAYIRSLSDRFLQGASGKESNAGAVAIPTYDYVPDATEHLPDLLKRDAGFQLVFMPDLEAARAR